jgi:hypothetical protein
MSLKKLVASLADATLFPVHVDGVRTWLLNEGLQERISFVPADINIQKAKGFIWQFKERLAPYAEPERVTLVFYAKSLNVCWRRFVCCKELMHIFDNIPSQTKSRDECTKLVSELLLPGNPVEYSKQVLADHVAIIKALVVLCPVGVTKHIRTKFEAGELSPYQVALFFRIPEIYVSYILSDSFGRAHAAFGD